MAAGDHKCPCLAHERTSLRREGDRAGPIGIDGVTPRQGSARHRWARVDKRARCGHVPGTVEAHHLEACPLSGRTLGQLHSVTAIEESCRDGMHPTVELSLANTANHSHAKTTDGAGEAPTRCRQLKAATIIVSHHDERQIVAIIEGHGNCAGSVWITGVRPGELSGTGLLRIHASSAHFECVRAAYISSTIKIHQAQDCRSTAQERKIVCGVEYEAVRADRGCDLGSHSARHDESENQYSRRT